MHFSVQNTGKDYKARFQGQFTFGDHGKFREMLAEFVDSGAESLQLYFDGVEYVDSAAIGMLLIAKEETDRQKKHFTVYHPRGQVEKVFRVSQLETLFPVHY